FLPARVAMVLVDDAQPGRPGPFDGASEIADDEGHVVHAFAVPVQECHHEAAVGDRLEQLNLAAVGIASVSHMKPRCERRSKPLGTPPSRSRYSGSADLMSRTAMAVWSRASTPSSPESCCTVSAGAAGARAVARRSASART